MCGGRGFGGVVIAHQSENAAISRAAREIGVAEDVAAPVNPRPLAVPEGEDAIVFTFASHLGLLRAPNGRRGEVFVEARLKDNLCGIEHALGAHEGEVEAAERRAPVARDEASRIEPAAPVEL